MENEKIKNVADGILQLYLQNKTEELVRIRNNPARSVSAEWLLILYYKCHEIYEKFKNHRRQFNCPVCSLL